MSRRKVPSKYLVVFAGLCVVASMKSAANDQEQNGPEDPIEASESVGS